MVDGGSRIGNARRDLIPFAMLSFDDRLQMRAGGLDAGWVDRLAELVANRIELDPLQAIEESQPDGNPPRLWIYDGFHRGAAYSRMGGRNVPVLVTPGTFDDALRLALTVNTLSRALPLRHEDLRRKVETVLDNQHLLQQAIDAGKGSGGLHRSIAEMCGVSKSLVSKIFTERSLRAEDGRPVPQIPDKQHSNENLSTRGQSKSRSPARVTAPLTGDTRPTIATQPTPTPDATTEALAVLECAADVGGPITGRVHDGCEANGIDPAAWWRVLRYVISTTLEASNQ